MPTFNFCDIPATDQSMIYTGLIPTNHFGFKSRGWKNVYKHYQLANVKERNIQTIDIVTLKINKAKLHLPLTSQHFILKAKDSSGYVIGQENKSLFSELKFWYQDTTRKHKEKLEHYVGLVYFDDYLAYAFYRLVIVPNPSKKINP